MRASFHRTARIIGALLLSAIFLGSFGKPATAQTPTYIETKPSPINLAVGQTANIEVWVEDAANVYSYYIRLYFNPAMLQIQDADPNLPGVQVRDGDFFYRPLSVTTSNWVDNSSGVVTYINSFIDPTTSISGSGKLLSFDLQAIAVGSGTSTISLSQSYLISPQGDLLPVNVLNPQVYISASAVTAATPTPTSTSQPVVNLTLTSTATATPTPDLTQAATSSLLSTPTVTGTLPAGVAPTEPLAVEFPGIYLPLVVKDFNSQDESVPTGPTPTLPRAALTHTPAPLTGAPPSVTPLAPASVSTPAPPPAAPFEDIGPVAWGAVILALIWLLVLVGYLVYRFVIKRPGGSG